MKTFHNRDRQKFQYTSTIINRSMQETTNNYSYKGGNSSPLRYSPKRGGEANQASATFQQQPSTFNISNVKGVASHTSIQQNTTNERQQTVVSHSQSYGASGSCSAAPTEKERMIAQLMQEAASLRTRERDYKALQD